MVFSNQEKRDMIKLYYKYETFLWGTLKNRVYGQQEYEHVEDLRTAVIEQCRSIRRRDIIRAVQNLERRARLCIQEEGRNFEQLL